MKTSLRRARHFINSARQAADDVAAQLYLKGREFDMPVGEAFTLALCKEVVQDMIVHTPDDICEFDYQQVERRFAGGTIRFNFETKVPAGNNVMVGAKVEWIPHMPTTE